MSYQPPFQLTHLMARKIANIGELIGIWKAANQHQLIPELRRENRIKTIQASLAVEQNTLTLDQVTAVIDGKTVIGLPREIQEVRNAFKAYEMLERWDPHQPEDMLTAHAVLMFGLADDAGQWRNKGAGIYRGDRLVHMAPPHDQIPRLMSDLFDWLKNSDAHPLIASTAFHYEFEFIHPFSDGNGRMGRLWQTLLLSHWQPMLAYLPVETVIKHRQQTYYQLLTESDQKGDCTAFIEFLLQAIEDSLQEAVSIQPNIISEKTRVETRVKTRVKTPEQILLLLQANPQMTLAEVAESMGKSVSAIERAVAKLKEQGKLIYIGSKKEGYWQVLDPKEP